MKAIKIIASVLTGVMLLSLTACFSSSNSSKKYEKAFEGLDYDTMDEWDGADFTDDYEDGIFYSTKDKKEFKDICHRIDKTYPIENVNTRNISSVVIGGREDDSGYFGFCSVTFNNKKDAEKSFEKSIKNLKKFYDEYKDWADKNELGQDDDDEFYVWGHVSSFTGGGEFYEIYMDDSMTVTYIIGYFRYADDIYDDYVDFYDAIERDCPTELVKNEVHS